MAGEGQGFGAHSVSLGTQVGLPTSWALFHHLENGDHLTGNGETITAHTGLVHSGYTGNACLTCGIMSGVLHVTPGREPPSPPDRRELKSQLERACSVVPLLRQSPFPECLPYSQHIPLEGLFSSESHHASPWRPSQHVLLWHHNHIQSCPQCWTRLRWGH